MCQRPRNGDTGFDLLFAIVTLSASMPVPEPVAVVPDQLAVPHGVVEFEQRDGERLLTVPSFAEQPFLFVQLVLLGIEQSVDGRRHAVAFGPCPERELQVCRQVAVDRGRKDRLSSVPPPSEPCMRISRTRLSSQWSYLKED